MNTLSKLLILLLITAATTALRAQEYKWEGGVFIGASNYQGDLVKPAIFTLKETNLGYGLLLRRHLDKNWALRLNLAGGKITGNDANFDERKSRGYSFSSTLTEATLLAEWDILGKRRWNADDSFKRIFSPYLFAGAGAAFTDTSVDFNDQNTTNIQRDKEQAADSRTNLSIPVGAGIKWDLNENWNLGVEMGYRLTVNDYLDGVSLAGDPDDDDWYILGGLTLTAKFGGGKDSDGDGVSDKKDECPQVPGVVALAGCPDKDNDGISDKKDRCPDDFGLADMYGCPDSDGDGVADKDDKCPAAAGAKNLQGCPDNDGDGIPDDVDECPDVRGLRSLNGCPDSDGDGVADFKDKCPEEAGIAANQGCPDFDADGDGVVDREDACPQKAGLRKFNGCPDSDGDGLEDSKDKCPNTPGSIQNNGCPDLKPEEKEVLNLAVRNVQFETAKATLKSESFAVLDQIVDLMKKYPDYHLDMKGYTDDVGNAAANQSLSEARAESCLTYIASKGINKKRMTAKGLGETNPVASNDTVEGRSRNRRVEFDLYPPKE